MIEIEIAFEYFDEGLSNLTKELEERIKLYKDNYLVYYIFCNNYCIFSNVEIGKIEAEILVKFIENDCGIDILYKEGLKTKYATYIIFQKENKNDNEINHNNQMFEEKLKEYVHNITKVNKVHELEKRNELYRNKIEKIQEENNKILESKELIKGYQKIVNNKDKEIKELKQNYLEINRKIEKIPKFIRKIFLK